MPGVFIYNFSQFSERSERNKTHAMRVEVKRLNHANSMNRLRSEKISTNQK